LVDGGYLRILNVDLNNCKILTGIFLGVTGDLMRTEETSSTEANDGVLE